jgi:hypothetical protein
VKAFRIVFTVGVLGSAGLYARHLATTEDRLPADAIPTPRQVRIEPLELPSGELELAGRIELPGGAPAPGALVHLRQGDEPRWAVCGEGGSFRIPGLEPGPQTAHLVARGRMPVTLEFELPTDGPVLWTLPERPEAPPPLPDLVRSDLTGELAGSGDAELEGFEVVLRPGPDVHPLSGAVARRARVDAAGAFAFEALVEAAYLVEVLPPWAAGGSWPVLARGEVLAGDGAELSIEVASAAVEGELVDLAGAPLAGALVHLSDSDHPERLWPPRATDSGGRFRIGDLPPGSYAIRVRAGVLEAERSVQLAAGETRVVVLRPRVADTSSGN